MNREKTIKVWDPLVRVFHWSLALLFFVSYLTAEEESLLHPWSGYAIVILLIVRLVWGFIGTRYARFSDFVYGPAEMLAYAKGLLTGQAKRYLGHNPLGGLMVVMLMSSLALTTLSGMILYGAEEGKGPLAGMLAGQSSFQMPQLIATAHADDDDDEHEAAGKKGDKENEFLEEVHEFFGNFTLLLVLLHLAGVFIESKLHKESLVKAMINGRKRSEAE